MTCRSILASSRYENISLNRVFFHDNLRLNRFSTMMAREAEFFLRRGGYSLLCRETLITKLPKYQSDMTRLVILARWHQISATFLSVVRNP